MNVLWGVGSALATYLVLGVLVSAGGRALDPLGLTVFMLLPIVVGTVAGVRRARRARRCT